MKRRNFLKLVAAAVVCPKGLSKVKPITKYGWTGVWADDWHGRNLVCERCLTKNCGIRTFTTKTTNYPEYNIGDRLETRCGWTFLYIKKQV